VRRHCFASARRAAAVALVLIATAGVAACSKDPGPLPTLRAFLAGWASGDLIGVGIESPFGADLTPTDVTAHIKTLAGDLDPSRVQAQPAADPVVNNGNASVPVNVAWTVVDGLVWPYQTTVQLHEVGNAWRVVFSPATVHPKLTAGEHFAVAPVAGERGTISDGVGQAIVVPRPVVTVGVEPQLVTDLPALVAALDAAFKSIHVDVDLSGLPGQLAAASPGAFVPVVTLRQDAYDQIRDRIHDLPGTVFRDGVLPLAPTRAFGRALLGTVGEVTKEQLDARPGHYLVGELVGQSGLEKTYDDLLRATPGVDITLAADSNPTSGSTSTPVPEVLFHADPKVGAELRTTLDQRVQSAADAALAGQPHKASVVAIRVSDGAILAVANGPDGGDLNLAFTASVPSGSTFKMVAALGVLETGKVTPDTVVDCPQVFTVDGRSFTNEGGYQLGPVPLHVAFAKSCNTAFASLAPDLGVDGLRRAATSLGIGTTWNLGTEVFTGSVGANESAVDAAAAAFGQGTTLVSPVSLAAAAAAVARGSWRAPHLFAQLPAGAPAPKPGTAGDAPADGAALPAGPVAALQGMMREVVTSGTGTGLVGVPGPTVQAKTGTAEYDNNPADTHAWVIGWQGDIAFAVFVDDGGDSGATAVPIAATFLRALA
jgi:cell division protein FtsI/penicillin-binding protein 2